MNIEATLLDAYNTRDDVAFNRELQKLEQQLAAAIAERDRLWRTLAAVLDLSKVHGDLTDSPGASRAWSKVGKLAYEALRRPTIADLAALEQEGE